MNRLNEELENIKNNQNAIHEEQSKKRKTFLARPELQEQRTAILAEMQSTLEKNCRTRRTK